MVSLLRPERQRQNHSEHSWTNLVCGHHSRSVLTSLDLWRDLLKFAVSVERARWTALVSKHLVGSMRVAEDDWHGHFASEAYGDGSGFGGVTAGDRCCSVGLGLYQRP